MSVLTEHADLKSRFVRFYFLSFLQLTAVSAMNVTLCVRVVYDRHFVSQTVDLFSWSSQCKQIFEAWLLDITTETESC